MISLALEHAKPRKWNFLGVSRVNTQYMQKQREEEKERSHDHFHERRPECVASFAALKAFVKDIERMLLALCEDRSPSPLSRSHHPII